MKKTDSNKIETMSKEVCVAIKNLSKKECEELNKYSKRQCTEINNMSKEVCEAINQHAKPRKFDKWNRVFTVLEIICSISAIIVAILIPGKIAKEQNKIALFDKRYEVYCEFQAIQNFLMGYSEVCSNEKGIYLDESYYEMLWEGEIHNNFYPDTENVGTVLRLQRQKVDAISFVFAEITEEEKNLSKEFFNAYNALTQRCVLLSNADAYILFEELDKVYVMPNVSNLMEKMKEQLILE